VIPLANHKIPCGKQGFPPLIIDLPMAHYACPKLRKILMAVKVVLLLPKIMMNKGNVLIRNFLHVNISSYYCALNSKVMKNYLLFVFVFSFCCLSSHTQTPDGLNRAGG
jgi:hypothetical protein